MVFGIEIIITDNESLHHHVITESTDTLRLMLQDSLIGQIRLLGNNWWKTILINSLSHLPHKDTKHSLRFLTFVTEQKRNKTIDMFMVIQIITGRCWKSEPLSFRTHYSAVKCGSLTANWRAPWRWTSEHQHVSEHTHLSRPSSQTDSNHTASFQTASRWRWSRAKWEPLRYTKDTNTISCSMLITGCLVYEQRLKNACCLHLQTDAIQNILWKASSFAMIQVNRESLVPSLCVQFSLHDSFLLEY